MIKSIAFLALAAMAACSTTPSNRLDMSAVNSELQVRAIVGSAMLRTVSLPTYAAAEEIAVEVSPGIIGTDNSILWADDPQRAITLAMTQHLDSILSATVGPDPWPFAGLPDVAIDVRVAQMLAGADGVFRLNGQYFVGGDGIDFPNGSHRFAITQRLAGTDTASIAQAQANAILALSEDIARKLGR